MFFKMKMSLTREHCQEDLSIAYISAVSAKAGYNCGRYPGHDYGIDIEIGIVEKFDNGIIPTGFNLHIQVKSSQNFILSEKDDCIIYDLDVRAYNMLAQENRGTPSILVLYCMPEDEDEWVLVHENQTILKHCGYWISLKGESISKNTSTHRIKIPKNQIFDESTLTFIMEQIRRGENL